MSSRRSTLWRPLVHEHSPAAPMGSAGQPLEGAGATERPLHVVSVQTSNERGGGEYANVALLEVLRERGMSVRLLTNEPALAAGTHVPVTPIELGPKLARSTVGRVATGYLPWAARLRRALEREASDAPIDVLLLHYKKEQLMSLLLPRGLVPTMVWAEWGPLPDEFMHGLPRRAYLRAARRAQLIVSVSGGTARSLEQIGIPPEKVAVIPNIVDGREIVFDPAARARYRHDWGVDADTFVIGCVSRLNAKKRTDVVIDALASLPDDVHLVVAGDGPNADAIRARAAPYGSRVHFLPTPRGYVQEVLSACDVAVMAAMEAEGAPRAIIFGQLTERPVVSTGPAGAEDMLPRDVGAITMPANDPRALAELLAAYRRDPERRSREGAAGRAFALARYDRATVGNEWEARLRALTGQPARDA